MRILAAIILLFTGFTIQWFFNGRPFTNDLIGIVCALGSAALAYSSSRTEPRWLWTTVLSFSTVLIIFLILFIPTAAKTQKNFNTLRENVRHSQPSK